MKTNNLTKELITRSNNLSFYKYIGVLPNPDKLFTRYGKTYQTYRDLLTDAHLWSCIQSRKSGVLSYKFGISQNLSSSEVFSFVEENFSAIDLQRLIRQILDAVLFGFQVFEITWTKTERSMYKIKAIEARPQEYFSFDVNGELKLSTNSSRGGVLKSVPAYKTLLVQYEADYDNPYGKPLLNKCYWPCTFKNTAVRFWINYIEKFGLPTIIASLPETIDKDEAQTIADNLSKMQDQNTIVAGSDIALKLYESNKSGSVELYRELINVSNAEISKAILSGTLTTEIGIGSYAAAKTHQEVRKDVIISDIELVITSVNKIIKMICELNYGDVKIPTFDIITEETE